MNGLIKTDIHKFALMYANSNYELREDGDGELLCVNNKEVIQVVDYNAVTEEVEFDILTIELSPSAPDAVRSITHEITLMDLLYKIRTKNWEVYNG